MTAPSEAAPEAQLLATAAGRSDKSAPDIAHEMGNVRVDTVRNWLKGYRTVSAGRIAAAHPNKFQLARLAVILKISSEELRGVGRDDAADELETVAPTTDSGDADAEMRYRRPEGMGDDQWQQVRRLGDAYIQGLLDQAATER